MKRLWWKEARQFWTIWVFVALAAAAGQWMALTYYGPVARQGPLFIMALAWTGFYAVATGAAAFAGERETGTLRLLDILPVSRPVVWAGKVSFAMSTTLALAALLLGMAATSTDRWGTEHFGPEGNLTPGLAACYGLIVLVAMTWALFWSSFLSNALTTALAALVSTPISMIFLMAKLDYLIQEHYFNSDTFVKYESIVILATLVASNLLFTRGSRRRRLPFQFKSPIVMTPTDSGRPGRLRIQSPARRSTMPQVRVAEATASDQSPRRSRLAEARALAWETFREGGTTWCLLAAIGLGIPVPFLLSTGYFEPFLMLLMDMLIGIVAGINVFGMEHRGRTQRFLTHHGARPGLVWLVKLTVWCVGLAAIWWPQAIITQSLQHDWRGVAWNDVLQIVSAISLAFAVALLCGMTIARGLTAAVIAVILTVSLAFPLFALVSGNLLPLAGLAVIPTALLAVSWAWSGDWLLDRPAPGRWLRLGSMLTGAFAVLLVSYAGFRAWSVPDVGPIPVPRAWIAPQSDPLQADIDMRNRDTNAIYDHTVHQLKSRYPGLDLDNRDLGLVRRAVARPDNEGKFLLDDLARNVIEGVRKRLDKGDLAGAWSGLINVFRMVRDRAEGAGMAPAVMAALLTERQALDLAMEWAVASRQTPEQLRAALAAIRDLPKVTSADEVLRADANLTERMIDLPTGKLEQQLESIGGTGQRLTGEFWTAAQFAWFTTPWERVRARRVNRLLAASAIEKAALEPWQHRKLPIKRPSWRQWGLPYGLASTPLARLLVSNEQPYLQANDLNEVGRRALVQVLALRAWQLRHDGQFPDSLDKLVPEELPSLPVDPYSGRIFIYVRSGGQTLPPLGSVLNTSGTVNGVVTPGFWLLYSVGEDYRDDGAASLKGNNREVPFKDIVFPIPPVPSGAGGDNKK